MKFEQLTNEVYGAKKAGYILDTDYKVVVNPEARAMLDAYHTEAEIDNIISNSVDSLFDFDEDLYRGDDGDLYIMKSRMGRDSLFPICWHRVRKENNEDEGEEE